LKGFREDREELEVSKLPVREMNSRLRDLQTKSEKVMMEFNKDFLQANQ